ncbi:glycosyltransferase [Hyphomonas jannaschiana]|uniref:Family 2 glycosyl transferase n=1 Tax=Hyphomonas jannaschiana VP2 TaxID=1280952 RepID=A0A059F6L8_9PROT|nr:glycosyltransferase [Hyphomonas jannaschiana]KCZ83917.1 family 2 glycosyl transferase [Hyphomonas jannaschiana VP2]
MPANSVTVLIPTFNRAHLLVETLDSILAQTRRPDEIIVINDGSTDDTLARLEPYRDDIKILNQDNAGKSAALNKALSVAKGDLIWVFDDDDIAEPDALETLLGLLKANPDADFAYGRHDRFEVRPDGRVKWRDTGYWRESPPEDFLFESLLDMFAHQPAMLVRKSLYLKAGAFDESLVRSQDYDMLLRLARHGRPVPTEQVLFHQRQHDLPRGTAAKVVEAAERDAVWQRYDRRIFGITYQALPLGKYLPADCSLTEPGMTRRALIRRGIVMARKNFWKKAGEDFSRAARISDRPLTREETADLRKTFMMKYGCDECLMDADVQALFFEIKHASPVGAQMARAAARAMVWRVRLALQNGKPFLAFRLASLVGRLTVPSKNVSREVPSSFVRR